MSVRGSGVDLGGRMVMQPWAGSVTRYVPAPVWYGEAAQSQVLEIMGPVDLPGFSSTGPMI